jgi:LAO/AO transport system kinase
VKLTLEQLAAGVAKGDRRCIGRAITAVEEGKKLSWDLLKELSPRVGTALRVGLTGPPGAGKSTLAGALVRELRSRDLSVGVIAVDPSSPFSGGALLGDRVRMLRATEDPEVFVRSMASRGCLGGLARTTQEAGDILDAAGKDVVLFETVGVGQSELTVASASDLTVVVMVPEAGGMVQAMKAGLMEIADLFVVNKADRPGAEEMEFQLKDASRYLISDGRRPPVLQTSAIKEEGIAELADEVLAYQTWLQEGDRKEKKRRDQAKTRIRELVRSALEENFWSQVEVHEALETAAGVYRTGDSSLVEVAQEFWVSVRDRLTESNIEGAD